MNNANWGNGNVSVPVGSLNNSAAWTLPENHGNDVIDGGQGNDFLIGQGKNDILFGGEGNDTIWGDAGNAANDNTYNLDRRAA